MVTDMMPELILSNARIVLEDEILQGSVKIVGGKIADISEGQSKVGEDFGGDYLIPGLWSCTRPSGGSLLPRPGVRWNKISAIQAHDAQIVTSGITTVFDCLRMGSDEMAASNWAKCATWRMPSSWPSGKIGSVPSICCTCVAKSHPATFSNTSPISPKTRMSVWFH